MTTFDPEQTFTDEWRRHLGADPICFHCGERIADATLVPLAGYAAEGTPAPADEGDENWTYFPLHVNCAVCLGTGLIEQSQVSRLGLTSADARRREEEFGPFADHQAESDEPEEVE